MTNSELQFHDLKTRETLVQSLERYTFYPDSVFTAAHFPTVVKIDGLDDGLPALYNTEDSEISKGFRVKVAGRSTDGRWQEIYSPAGLRFKSERGCRPLASPVTIEEGSFALDFYCGDKFLRLPLSLTKF